MHSTTETVPGRGPQAPAAPDPASAPLSATDRTRLRRGRHKQREDRAELYALLDEGLFCHLGVVVDGAPRVMPTAYGRIGDTLYLHGSTGARSMNADGEVCVTVTLVDALVLARSAFHHSVNHRSAMVYGRPRVVTDPDERTAGLRALTEQIAPGRWAEIREPDRKEMAATRVLALSLAEASVKVRTGPPGDEEEDMDLDVWAGIVPVRQVYGEPEPDPLLKPGIGVPRHLREHRSPA
ncbi:pyridoxamine 5'-phosphate oxidase family protein [Nocardiopsis changdeensis]|uniref:Pyridoxamine 5'-phosphate oxidase family protein n=1 Tax=Nocardiopsis changdeensis TaxID=2831969 RepID=A0ABX8BEL2_9ACTN|nr:MULTISPECIES: pyridoxamine 5'-phosphate oxidase family protein [Nocardiopsis]QUX20687.1 pyridoxamine 5'-phosphate oxidase family protein [Nocardiopsis changdeensis]QYX36619.1 pyridoxamine 5'-phosphate oxidase family protein [Nocardiopsis sp. MT53]